MGLLDRWSKKTTEEKLQDLDTKKPVAKTVAKTKKTTVAKTKKSSPAKEAVSESTVDTTDVKGKISGIAHKILVRPLITEKAAVAQSQNKYTFVVATNATKNQIKQAVFEAYGITPIAVNVVNVDGHRVRFGRTMGRRSDSRKAIVTLPKGKSITIHEGV